MLDARLGGYRDGERSLTYLSMARPGKDVRLPKPPPAPSSL
ncbi:hypothetical protein ACFVYR_25335 [Streptomyces sp. NPDC058284]